MNGLSTVEQQITAANTGKFVQDADRKEIKQALAYCFSITGLSALPTELEMEVLLDFIINTYGTYRLQEIRTAFQLAAADRLPTADGKPIEHYQTFSAQYFGKVMSAFTKRSTELKKYQEAARSWNQPVTPLTRANEMSDESSVRLSYQNYIKMRDFRLIYPLNYDCLKRHGFGLTDEEGRAARIEFNRIPKDGYKFPETDERKFKQYLTAKVFEKFIQEGKTDIQL